MHPSRLLAATAALFVGAGANAQLPAPAATNAPPGIVLLQDSAYQVRFRFRMQDRATLLGGYNHGVAANSYDMQVRRFRLKLEGFAVSPRLEYKIQIGLADHDMAIGDGTTAASPLLDAMVFYKAAPHTRIGFGQGKLPGGRQAIISSGELQLPERPIANRAFTLDRDKGIFLVQDLPLAGRPVRVQAAVSNGQGRAAYASNKGLCYTGRLEWFPFGEFHANGAYVEGDQYREPAPKLAVAAAYSTDRNALRQRAQQGPLFPLGQDRTINTFFADAMFKYKGFAWENDFAHRLAGGSPFVQDTTAHGMAAVNEGWGLTSQASRMLGKKAELIARYSMVRPDAAVGAQYHNEDEAVLGLTYYLNGHRVKLQTALLYQWRDGIADMDHAGNHYGAMLQVELGI